MARRGARGIAARVRAGAAHGDALSVRSDHPDWTISRPQKRRFGIGPIGAALALGLVMGVLPAIGSLPADAAIATQLVFTSQPGDANPGPTLATQPTVTIEDNSNAPVSSSSTITLTLTDSTGKTLTGVSSLTCDQTSGGITSMSASGGIAAFTGCKVAIGGSYTLTGKDTADNLTEVSASFFVSGPAQLPFTSQPGGGVAATSWDAQPEITIEDGNGIAISNSTASVHLAIQSGTGTPGATLTCDHNTVTVDSNGVASFSGCRIDKVGTGYKLVATDGADSLISLPSDPFDIQAGSPTSLAFAKQPSIESGGAAFSNQPQVDVKDIGGNVIAGNTDAIGLSITSGTGAIGASLACDHNPVSAVDGVANFSGCSVDDASSTPYTLTATDSTRSLSVTSGQFSVNAGAATRVAFSKNPGGGAGGAALGTQPIVTLTDAGGNPVPGSVTLSLLGGTTGATLTCASNPLPAPSGVAQFSGCRVDDTGNGYQLTATSGSLHAASTTFDVTPSGPSKASFTVDPGDGHGGTALSPQPTVALTDSGDIPAAGAVTLSITPGTGTPGATLTCADNFLSTSGPNETATFSGCSVDKAGTGYTLTATSGSVTVTSQPFSVDVGPAARLAFTTPPGGGTGGSPWDIQPVVAVEDAGGNQLPDSTAPIALSVTPSTGSGTLTCTADSLPAVRGAALFSGCSIDKAASAYTLTAEDAMDALSQTSNPFEVSVGAPAQLLFSNQPSGGNAGAPWAAQPTIAVGDAGGNVTSSTAGIALALVAGTGTPGATLSCAANPVGASAGRASFSACSIDKAASGYTLVATDSTDGLSGESLPFPVLVPPPGPLGVAPTGVPLAETFGTSTYARNPTAVTDDVNSATGALTFVVGDLRVAGIGEPLVLQRTYNSGDRSGGSFGPGWTSILDASVTVVSQKTATVRGEDGQQIVFSWNPGSKSWAPPPGARATLSCTAKQCTVSRFDGVTLVFNLLSNGHGQLASYLASDGQGLSFTWTSSAVTIVLDTTNSTPTTVSATLDRGRVTHVSTPAGRSVSYGYSAGLLASVTDVRGGQWSYSYNAAGLLTSETAPGNHDRLTATYDGNGRVIRVSAKGSPQHTDDTFAYVGNQTTRNALVDANGTMVRIPYVDRYLNNVLVSQTTPWGGISRYSYDAQVNLIESQDPMGWVQQLSYDANNNMVSQSSPISSASSATIKMTYDGQHRILSQTDADGNTTSYVYNGAVVGTIHPPGANATGTRLTYNPAGELVLEVGPVGQEQFSYDGAGNQTGVVLQDPSGHSLNGPGTRTTYDEAGDATSRTDANGNTTSYTYDAAGNLLTTVAPGPQTTTNTYTEAGDIATVTDAVGNITAYSWDEATLTRRSVTTPAGGSAGAPSTQTFDPSGNLLVEGNSANRGTTHVFDASGREVSKTDASNLTIRLTYDIEGNIVASRDTAGDVMTQQFDSQNRMTRQVVNGAVTLTTYDANGNVISSTNSAGNVTTSTYTSHGKPASVSNAAGTTTYGYDLADDLVTTTDPNGHVTNYKYDGASRQTSMTANGNTTSYTYDNNGNVKTQTDPDGRLTAFAYNSRNQPTSTLSSWSGHPTLTVSRSYNALGRRTAMTDAGGTQHTYSYNLAGDLTKAKSGNDTFTYDYSQPGKIIETYPDGTTISYAVDDQQNLMSLEADQPQGTTNLDNAGQVKVSYIRNQSRVTTGISFSNGIFESDAVNQNGQVLNQSLQLGGNPVANDALTYDAAGNPISQVDTALGKTTTNQYGYDASGRLTGFSTSTALASNARTTNTIATSGLTSPNVSSTIASSLPTLPTGPSTNNPSGPTTTAPAATTPRSAPVIPAPTGTAPPYYSYDATGNIVSSGSGTSTYNASNELTAQAAPGGTTHYGYDRNGDLVSAAGPSGTTTYSYDAADHLVGVHTPSSTISYTYDGDGNRTSKTIGSNTIQYVWDVKGAYPRLTIERKSDGTLIRRYIYGDGPVAMQTPTRTYFYHLDPQGSVGELSDANGAIVAAYTYDGYGNVTTVGDAAPPNPLLFQGQYLDSDTGLYNMRARNYDAKTGRFTQQDPVAAAVGTPAWSPYSFANDRPTDLADPTGRTTSGSDTRDFAKGLAGEATSANQPISGTQTVTSAKVVSTTAGPVRFALSKAVSYLVKSLSSSMSNAAAKVGSSAGEAAEAVSEVAASSGSGWLGAEAGEQGAKAGKLATFVKFLGPALIVAGIAIGVYVTIEACEHGPVSTCVGDAVGNIVGAGLTILCTVESAGAAAVGCGLAAGIISAALTEVISRYGPQIADGFVTAYTATAAALSTAYTAVSDAFISAAGAISDVATSVGGAIATGFNTLTTAISSGFQTAMSTLVDAGYSALQLATTLAEDFTEGVNDAVGALVSLGYQIDDVFQAATAVFATTADQAAQLLKDGFNYTVNEVAGVMKDVYALGDEAAAQILKNVNFAVNQVASALEDVYNRTADVVAGVLQDVKYEADQIGAALQQVFSETDQAVATALHALGYAADVVASALVGLYHDVDTAVAAALDFATYAYDKIAGALDTVFQDVGQVAAGILKTLNTCTSNGAQACVVAIAGALQSAYDFLAPTAAQILENINFAVDDVATALKSVFQELDTGVATVLREIGNTAAEVGTALKHVFADVDQGVAIAMRAVGYAVADVATALGAAFQYADQAVASVLKTVGYAVTDVANALETAFGEAAQQAAAVLKTLFSIDEVATALEFVFGQLAQDAASILKAIGYTASEIAGALQEVFAEAAAVAAQILKDIGEAASDIASALEGVFGELVGDIGNILSDIGFDSSTIDAIGGALASFGQSVSDCFTSGFSDC